MDRKTADRHISETYQSNAEFLWKKYPNYAVYRHGSNQKWFAIIMEIPKEKLEQSAEGRINILNVKCDPNLIGSLRKEPGFYPAYHMNKTGWITVALDGRVDDDKIKWLLDMSFDLTSLKGKRAKTQSSD